MDIAAWLRDLGLEQHAAAFERNGVDAGLLADLSNEDLKDLGVSRLAERKRLLKAIAGLPSPSPEPFSAGPSRQEVHSAERRQLTVMFVDMVGSTVLSRRLDPEEMQDVLRQFQKAVAGEISGFGGHVAKFMGDGVLAYFGWPMARENAAESAVRAALAIHQAIAQLAAPHGTPIVGRIGVASGLVVVGDLIGEGTAQEHTVAGETPHLAARLQERAAPGSVVIGETTRQLVGDLFEVEKLEDETPKGFDQPVPAYHALRERRQESRFEAIHARSLQPIIDRRHERAVLRELWDQVCHDSGRCAVVVGEAGIGKSRLLLALREDIASDDNTCLTYQGLPYHTGQAFYPVIRQLQYAAGIAHDDPPDVRLDRIRRLIDADGGDEAAIRLLSDLLHTPERQPSPMLEASPARQKMRTIDAMLTQLARLCARSPVLLILEDAHWLDPSTLELINLVIARLGTLRMLVVVTGRPEFEPSWTDQGNTLTITLEPLPRRFSTRLAEVCAGEHNVPAGILGEIIAKAGGVPLYIEELTKTVMAANKAETASPNKAHAGAGKIHIPATLHESLVARLDRLGEARGVAVIGAAIGSRFSYALLQQVADVSAESLQAALRSLIEAGIIESERGSAGRDAVFCFRHALLQEAAYESLLKSARRSLHARIAEAATTTAVGGSTAEPEFLARHFALAGNASQAVTHWQAAGQRELLRSNYSEAILHLGRALDLVAESPESGTKRQQEAALINMMGPALIATHGFGADEVGAAYARARILCDELGAGPESFRTHWGSWVFYLVRAELNTARSLAAEMLRIAEEAGDAGMRLEGHWTLGDTLFWLGELEPARRHLEAAVALYTAEEHRGHALLYGQDPGVAARCYLAFALWALGWDGEARRQTAAAREMARDLGHPFSIGWALGCSALWSSSATALPTVLSCRSKSSRIAPSTSSRSG